MDEKRFNIDFFELSFLIEACIPPRPIARSMFFESVSETYYHEMTKDERSRLLEWLQRNSNFSSDKDDVAHFIARFDQTNQYLITTECNGKVETHETYKWNNQYHTDRRKSILEEFITDIKHVTE